jgi:D-3-phosphoglycerate dehydrogenase
LKILHLDTNHPLLLEELAKAGFKNSEAYTATKAEVEKVLHRYDGVVIRSRFPIDSTFIQAGKNLKFIARVGAGVENIDALAAKKRGIKLIAAPEGNRNAVGEHCLGLLLSLFNKLNKADGEVKKGIWNREGNRGVELDGKIVGIIGYGNMGKSFAKKLKGFDCTVFCYDIQDNVGNKHATQVSLKTLQEMADVVSLHTPLTPLTQNMVNSEFISAFTKPFWLLNTARGKSVVTKDLVHALSEGKILGAGLDVLEFEKSSFEALFAEEMPPELSTLLSMENVLLSPHVAGWTVESKEKLAQAIVEKIVDIFGKKLGKKNKPIKK